ncbi:hypothetical protein P9112_012591 [Eukaryota sp. TZLM1-RC]
MSLVSPPTITSPSTTTKISCRWRDGKYYMAEILATDSRDGKPVYYVHFINFNRRLDQWVDDSYIDYTGSQVVSSAPDESLSSSHGPSTRASRRETDDSFLVDTPAVAPELSLYEKERIERTKFKNVQQVQLGMYVIDTWYFSPYPPVFTPTDCLYICEYCLKYLRCKLSLQRHSRKCRFMHPPGEEIYRSQDGKISMFELNGCLQRLYCQNLCLLAKLFLDHKTLHFDVDPFLFYVLCENDESGSHIVGYFSKEKFSKDNYNLACILTLPPYQKKGYGSFLIQFSYELTKIEGKTGSPEKPLSDLGYVSYRSYWKYVLLNVLIRRTDPVSIHDLAKLTGIAEDDVTKTLQSLNLVKYYKGSHMLLLSPDLVERHLATVKTPKLLVDSSRIRGFTGYPGAK